MGCFSVPKNKSKVAAASQQAEQQQPQQASNNFYHGSKLEQLLSSGLSSGLSSNKPVVLPDPDDLPGQQSQQGTGPIPARTSVRGGRRGNKPQKRKGGKERAAGGTRTISSSGSYLKNPSARFMNDHPRALSAPFNFHSYPPSSEDRRSLQVSQSDNNNHSIPFSAPLPSYQSDNNHPIQFSAPLPFRPAAPNDGTVSPVSPKGAASHGSPLHTLMSSASVAAADGISRGPPQPQLGLDKRVTKAFVERKPGFFTGRPVRLPKPQPATAHPLPLPHPPELDEAVTIAAAGLPAAFTTSIGTSSSVSPSPSRGKEGFGPSSYGYRSAAGGGGGGGNSIEALPLPPPTLPTHSRTPVSGFPFAELAPALVPENFLGEGVFGRAYRAWVNYHGIENIGDKKIEVAVVCPPAKSLQGVREWMAEVNWLARLQNPHLCKLIGYSAEDASGKGNRRLLVYEFMNNGSLDMFIKGCGEGSSQALDWSARMRIAFDVSQGLTYLHDKAPFQVICRDLSSPSIQLDKDFRAKLSGFGLARCGPEGDQGLLMVGPYVAPESGRSGLVTIKSNAWSFGVVLLELLTGRRHMDPSFPSGQQNLIQLTKPFLRDEGKLFLIMDPDLNGRYSGRGALKVANLAFQCLINEASLRPNLSEAVEVLRTVQIDEEALACDLKKSRSLTQSLGSPVTYHRSTSDHFVQRAFNNSNSLTSSPSHQNAYQSGPQQRDREFLKMPSLSPSTLGSGIASPSYVESRLSAEQKPPKSIFSDREVQKLPLASQQQQQQPFESRLMHVDNSQPSLQFSDAKQRDLRKVGSSGTPSLTASSSDSKRTHSSPPTIQVNGRGEVTQLQAPNLAGPLPNSEIRQQMGEAEELSTERNHAQDASQSSEMNKQQCRETTKFQAPPSQYNEFCQQQQQQNPEARKLPTPEIYASSRSRSGELRPEGWKSLSRQSSMSSRSRSGEQKPRSSDLRKLPTPQSSYFLSSQSGRSGEFFPQHNEAGRRSGEFFPQPNEPGKRSGEFFPQPNEPGKKSGEFFPQPNEAGRRSGEFFAQNNEAGRPSMGSRPVSGEMRQPHGPPSRKTATSSHVMDSGTQQHSSDNVRQQHDGGDFQRLPVDERRQRRRHEIEEQEIQKPVSQPSAKSRLSCAPALSFDPPMAREEFCVW